MIRCGTIIALLNFGFTQVKPKLIFNQNDILKTIRVTNGKADVVKLIASNNMVIPVAENDQEEFSTVIDAPDKVEAPVVKGQKLGEVKIFYQNTQIATVDLLAGESIERKSFFRILVEAVIKFFTFFKFFAVK